MWHVVMILHINPSAAKTKLFRDGQVITMAANALGPWVTRSSVAMKTLWKVKIPSISTPLCHIFVEK